jgi:glycosyltransferase involved in cell wall biosynthesis
MRALQLLGPSTGGIRVHVATLAAGLEDRGVEAPVVGPAGVLHGLGPQVGVVAVPAGTSPGGLLAARRSLAPWRGPADVIHAHGLKAGWVAVRGRPDRPVVLTLHNVVLDQAVGRAAGAQRLLERAVIRRADRVIAPTDAIAAGLDGVVPRERVRVIVPVSPSPRPEIGRAEVRARLGVSDDTPLVVCVARLHPQKDLVTLLRAWAAVATDVPRARLAVIGEGPERGALEALITDLGIAGSVTLAGFGTHAVDQIAAADVLAISSVWEAIPLVLAEALQLGVPVVSTRVGMAERLLGDGAGGFVVDVGDAPAMAHALVALLGDPGAARTAGRNARERSRDVFGPDALVEAVLDVYREVA